MEIECWACFRFPKSILFALFSKFQFFIDSGAFWEGLGRVLGGFGESFGRVWGGFREGLGRVWEGFGEGLRRGWGGFGKVLGMKFSSHWRNEGRPADCALRLNNNNNKKQGFSMISPSMVASSWPQVSPRWLVLAHAGQECPQIAFSCPKLAPSEPQVGPKFAPCWPLLCQFGSKLVPSWLQVGPCWPKLV